MLELGKVELRIEELRLKELSLEELRLGKANRHIATVEEHIRYLRERIDGAKARENPVDMYQATLSTMLETLYVMKGHQTFILERLDYLLSQSSSRLRPSTRRGGRR